MNNYELSRGFWDFAFENPDKIKPNHASLYFFIVEHCNRLGWKKKFGLPTTMTLDAIGIKSYSVYKKTFDQLAEFGFIDVVQYSKNQYSANIIALKENNKASTKANDKALDKALIKHGTKQSESTVQSTVQSIDSIIKQLTTNKEQLNKEQLLSLEKIISDVHSKAKKDWRNSFEIYLSQMNSEYDSLIKDEKFIKQQEKFHPNVDIRLSLEKAKTNFWGTEAGWRHKKKAKSNELNWKTTYTKAIDLNKVYRSRNGSSKENYSVEELFKVGENEK